MTLIEASQLNPVIEFNFADTLDLHIEPCPRFAPGLLACHQKQKNARATEGKHRRAAEADQMPNVTYSIDGGH